MSDLEPPFGDADPGGMAGRIADIPEQIEAALDALRQTPWRLPTRSPDLLAVGAMGGSAMSADFTAALYRDRLPRPLLVARDYAWPACVTERSLAVLSSYSGDTEETLALEHEAAKRNIPRVAVTTGGELGRRCESAGVACFRGLPAGSPPRAAFYASWVVLTGIVHALGWADDPGPSWRRASSRLRERGKGLAPDVPEARNAAKQLARSAHGRTVLVYAASGAAAPVATRIRQQLNENAKVFGHSALVPELNHNEIMSWEKPGHALGRATVVVLHDAEDAPRTRARLRLTADLAKERGAVTFEIEASDGDRLGRMAELAQFGDYFSLYLALLNGVDPTPVTSIDAFKRKLAAGAGDAN